MIGIDVAEWSKPLDRQRLKSIRHRVFVEEQGISCRDEIDGFDASCRHLIAIADGIGCIGCARIMTTGQLGRMAVQKAFRGRGIGASLLKHAIEEARLFVPNDIFLHAQSHAEAFYTRFGFIKKGGTFEEAGISHILMTLNP